MTIRLLPLLILVLTGEAFGATYYLDAVNGQASCSGLAHTGCNNTACQSYAALDTAVSFAAGDHIKFCTGTYRESITVGTDGLILEAAPSATPVVSGFDLCTSWSSEGSGVYSCSFTPDDNLGSSNGLLMVLVNGAPLAEAQQTGCPSPATNISTVGFCANYPKTACTNDGNCSAVGGSCTVASWCWTSNTLYLHQAGGGDPTGETVEVGSRSRNLTLTNRSDVTVTGLTLRGGQSVTSSNGRDDAIWASNATDLTFTHNIVEWAANSAMIMTFGDVGTLTITDNTWRDIGQGVSYHNPEVDQGAWVLRVQGGGYDALTTDISRNTVTDTGTHNWDRNLGGNCGSTSNTDACYLGAFNFENAAGSIVMDDNIITNCEGGLWWKIDHGRTINAGSHINHNVIRGWPLQSGKNSFMIWKGICIACESNGSTASGGVLDCDDGTGTHPILHEVDIDGNTIEGGWTGLTLSVDNLQGGDDYTVSARNNFIRAGDRSFGWNPNAGIVIWSGSAGIRIDNNTVQCLSDAQSGGSGLSDCGEQSSNSCGDAQAEFTNNIFDFAGCGNTIADTADSDTWATNLCGSAIGGICDAGANSLVYTDESTVNFHLTSAAGNAAAVDQGTTLASVPTDFDGQNRPMGAAVDIGADEFSVCRYAN